MLTVNLVANDRRVAVKVVNADLARLVHRDQASSRAGGHQVAGDFGLAVGGDNLAAGETMHVNRMPFPGKYQFDTVVHDAFGFDAVAHTHVDQHVHRCLLQNPGADAAQNVVRALALDDDVVNAGLVQQCAQEQTCRAGTDDGNLCWHENLPIKIVVRSGSFWPCR